MSKVNQQKYRGANGFSKDKVKAEVKEKVREIRLRQQNWMKQREEQQLRVASTVPTPSTSSVQVKNKETVSSLKNEATSNHSSNKRRSADNTSQPKGQFKTWLQTRGATFDKADREKNKNVEASKNSPNHEDGNKFCVLEKGVICNETVHHSDGRETNLLRLNSDRSVECATPDPGWNKDQVLGPSSSRSDQLSCLGLGSPGIEHFRINGGTICPDQALHVNPPRSPDLGYNPNQYETLADEIITRVKQTLDLKTDIGDRKLHMGANNDNTNQAVTGVTCNHGNSQASGTSPVSNMSSHNCPICRQLMLSPHHEPMLVIPCGHTVCDSCLKGRSLCPACQSPVTSCMGNLMLQQIIEGFQRQRLIKERQLRKTNPAIQSYQPLLYSEKEFDYTELYSNLKTRHEVLSQESSSLRKQVGECTQNVHKERKQVENIEREETKLTNEISELTSRLNDLKGHRTEYEVKVTELGQKKEEMVRKLRLIEDTLSNVENQMEKIELLQDGS